MGKFFLFVIVLVQAGAMFGAGMLYAYRENGPAAILLAIGGVITAVESAAVANIRFVYEKEYS